MIKKYPKDFEFNQYKMAAEQIKIMIGLMEGKCSEEAMEGYKRDLAKAEADYLLSIAEEEVKTEE